MKAMVTGATGFIGGNLVRELLADGTEVRALVRPGTDATALSELGVEIAAGDLLDEGSLARALDGCEALFHVAALYRLWGPRPEAFREVNVRGTRNVLEAALASGVEKVVYTSTAAVFGHWKGGPLPSEKTGAVIGDMVDGYHRSKYQAETEALKYCCRGLCLVIVNPTAPVGPWDVKPTPTGKTILDFIKGKMPAYLDTGLNVVHVRDVARGHILALEKGKVGARYILGGRNITLKELFHKLGTIAQRPAPSLRIPYWAALGAAYLDHWLSVTLLRREPVVPLAGVRMARHHMYYDSSKAVLQLGLPQTPVEEALEDAVVWFRKQFNVEAAA